MKTYTDFDEAVAAAFEQDLRLGGCYLADNVTPCYFLHADDVTEEEVYDLAFLIRNERSRTDLEKELLKLAKAYR